MDPKMESDSLGVWGAYHKGYLDLLGGEEAPVSTKILLDGAIDLMIS